MSDQNQEEQQVETNPDQQIAQEQQQNNQEEQKQEQQVVKEKEEVQLVQEENKDMSVFIGLINDPLEIEIRISESVEKGSGLSKHTSYCVKGVDKLGDFEVFRRYSEFHTLREILLSRWPGIYIPPIPEKTMSGTQQEVVGERIKLLNGFLSRMSQLKYLYYGEEFQAIFLRSKDADVAKQLTTLPKLTCADMIQRYQHSFQLEEVTEPPTEALTKITYFQVFLKKIQAQLKQQLEQSKVIVQSRKTLREQLVFSLQTAFPEYERNVLNDCVGTHKRLVFVNPAGTTIQEVLVKLKEGPANSLEKIQDLLISEQRDLDALLQAIQSRESMVGTKAKIESKLKEEQEELQRVMQGKQSLKASITKISQEEQKAKLEQQISDTTREAANQRTLFQLVTLILSHKQIDQYKKNKVRAYHKILNELSKSEIEYMIFTNQFWKVISEFTNQVSQEQ